MTLANWTADRFDWQSTAVVLRANLGVGYLLNVYNYLDSNDTERSTIYVTILIFTTLRIVNCN